MKVFIYFILFFLNNLNGITQNISKITSLDSILNNYINEDISMIQDMNIDLLLQTKDTLYISFYIAYMGEFGGRNEGILLFKNKENLRANYIIYNDTSYSLPLEKETIINFYKSNKKNYQIIENWSINSSQIEYLKCKLNQLKKFAPKKGFSNASEHYTIFNSSENYLLIDRTGDLNIGKEFRNKFVPHLIKK